MKKEEKKKVSVCFFRGERARRKFSPLLESGKRARVRFFNAEKIKEEVHDWKIIEELENFWGKASKWFHAVLSKIVLICAIKLSGDVGRRIIRRLWLYLCERILTGFPRVSDNRYFVRVFYPRVWEFRKWRRNRFHKVGINKKVCEKKNASSYPTVLFTILELPNLSHDVPKHMKLANLLILSLKLWEKAGRVLKYDNLQRGEKEMI